MLQRFAVLPGVFVLLYGMTVQVVAQETSLSVAEIIGEARTNGDAHRGVLVFGSPKFACVSCHQVGTHGGRVGPALDKLGLERPAEEIVESLLFPKQKVKPEYESQIVATEDGQQYRGYLVKEENGTLTLKEPSTGELRHIKTNSIEARKVQGTLMPEGLVKAMSRQQLLDVVRFLLDLGHPDKIDFAHVDSILEHALSHAHGPTQFEFDRRPLQPQNWPHWAHPVNRDRIYDFYTKQAEFFRTHADKVSLLAEFPGLDGGTLGHWGNQNEESWADPRWNATDLGSFQAGVFRGAGHQIPRGMCVQLEAGISACFDPQTLTYPVVWKDGFIDFSAVRHGFIHGLQMQGKTIAVSLPKLPEGPRQYLGMYRNGRHVLFRFRIGDVDYLSVPTVVTGEFRAITAPLAEHPLRALIQGGTAQWPDKINTAITLAEIVADASSNSNPYVLDNIELPFENPWNALLFFGGHAFLADGSAMLCTMQGDVWHVTGLAHPSTQATWKRFASGLHQPQGIVIDNDGIFVLGRDQITRLHDLNQDGEADYYECFCNAYHTSPAGHDYICGLERDSGGRFYTASGNQGLLQISPDGQSVKVLATGFRNPDGLGITSDGMITIPCSEGSWTPSSMICGVPTESPLRKFHPQIGGYNPPFFGLGGPQNGLAPDLPMVYLPRGLDNSSGGQVEVNSDRWGPLQGQMIHLSFGTGSQALLLKDEVNGQLQGGIVPLPGEFLSGAHRGRFSPVDGQLYVSGMSGWGSYTIQDGSFQRVRYTGRKVQLPVGFHTFENGLLLKFSVPVDPTIAQNLKSHFLQAWNYRYSPGYGSPEFSTRHYGTPGHDVLQLTQVVLLPDGKSLFLEIPELQPVNQLHIRSHLSETETTDLFLTIHALDAPYAGEGVRGVANKIVAPHPILKDVAYAAKVKPNRWTSRIPEARKIVLETGTNLSFKDRTLRSRAGEPLSLTLVNPDVVPHNWALIQPGTLHQIGDLSNQLIADPDAFITHYIPDSPDVLVHTDVVQPHGQFTIDFKAPTQPGTYPFLCTFPGHWLVMNGELIVE